MGTASKIASICLRVSELVCAAIVAGLEGHYLYLVDRANDSPNGRIVYTEVIAGLSIAFSLILMLPMKYSFYGFPLDFTLFICWIVAFGLMMDVSLPYATFHGTYPLVQCILIKGSSLEDVIRIGTGLAGVIIGAVGFTDIL